MRLLLNFFLLVVCINASAQSEVVQSIKSKSKTIIIELVSLNQLTLKNSQKKNEIVLAYNNHTSYKKPKLYEEAAIVYVKVAQEEDFLLGSQQNKYRAGQPQYPNYTIEVPKNAEVKIVYTKGNFNCNDFMGNLELYLNHGEVNLTNTEGSFFIQSYGGLINCSLKDTSIFVENNKGITVSKLKYKELAKTKTSLKAIYGNPLNKLHVKTVTAKVSLEPLADK